jgi:hypothetical protein
VEGVVVLNYFESFKRPFIYTICLVLAALFLSLAGCATTMTIPGAPLTTTQTTSSALVSTIISGALNFMSLNCVGNPVAGQLTTFQADLKNLTGTDTEAYINAEVYSGDRLIDDIKSDSHIVPGGGDTMFATYYKFQTAGNYTINAQAVYNGKTTQQVTLQLQVSGSGNVN